MKYSSDKKCVMTVSVIFLCTFIGLRKTIWKCMGIDIMILKLFTKCSLVTTESQTFG